MSRSLTMVFFSFIKYKINEHNKVKTIWNKVLKNGPSEICGKQRLKNLK